MCRELTREPAWVAAIKLALTKGWVDTESVMGEANLVAGRERTVDDVLSTMADRRLLREAPDFDETGRYLVAERLVQSAPAPSAINRLSETGVHRWGHSDD